MCHCFSDLAEMSEEERTNIVAEHSTEELSAEYSDEELDALGVTV